MIDVPESLDRRSFTQEVSSLVSRYHDMSQGRMEIGRALLDLTLLAQTYHVAVPSSLTLLGKTMLNLDGTLRILAPDLNPVQVIHSYLEHIMQQQVQKQVSAARISAWLLDTRHLVEQLPRRTDVVIEKLAHDQFTMHLKIDHLGTTLDRAAKRISFGMIIASLILSIGLYFHRKVKGN
jgi:ubiquinone biosynthesis protein